MGRELCLFQSLSLRNEFFCFSCKQTETVISSSLEGLAHGPNTMVRLPSLSGFTQATPLSTELCRRIIILFNCSMPPWRGGGLFNMWEVLTVKGGGLGRRPCCFSDNKSKFLNQRYNQSIRSGMRISPKRGIGWVPKHKMRTSVQKLEGSIRT